LWRVTERHLDGMSLARANPPTIITEGEPLFLTRRDDLIQLLALNGGAVLATCGEKDIDVHPSGGVWLQSNPLRIMTQNETQELARPSSLFLIHNSKLNPRFFSAEYLRVSNRKSCAGR
jgi:hypothetical protein